MPIKKEDDQKLADSPEVRRFLRALAIAHSNAIERVMRPDDPDSVIAQAKTEFTRLRNAEELLHPPPKCNLPYIWDEKQQRCVLP